MRVAVEIVELLRGNTTVSWRWDDQLFPISFLKCGISPGILHGCTTNDLFISLCCHGCWGNHCYHAIVSVLHVYLHVFSEVNVLAGSTGCFVVPAVR